MIVLLFILTIIVSGCANEYGCLGNIIFNIGLALSRGHRYMDSCALLNAACKLLRLSCNADGALIQKVSGPL